MSFELTDLVGVHLAEAPPVGHVQMKLRRGLTVLYGKNGVGKTRVVDAMRRAFESGSDEMEIGVDSDGHQFLVPYDYSHLPRALETMYYNSGFHLRCRVAREGGWSPILASIEDAAKQFGFATAPETFMGGMVANWDDLVLYVLSRLPFEASIGDAEYLLNEGRWIVSATPTGPLTICDPDPFNGPLSEHWQTAASVWASSRDRPRMLSESGPLLRYNTGDANYRFGWVCEIDWRESIRGGPPPGLPPLPAQLRLDPYPAWFGFPVASLGRGPVQDLFGQVIKEDSTDDVTGRTIAMIPYRAKSVDWATDGQPLAGFSTSDALHEVCIRANRILARLFEEPPLLHAHLTRVEDWMKGRPSVYWSASTGTKGDRFSLRDLGEAHRRYAIFAIQQALSSAARDGVEARFEPNSEMTTQVGGVTVALIDEPEAALNPSAERQVALGLAQLADYVIVATHSAVVVDSADSIVHVARDDANLIQLQPLAVDLDPAHRQLEARRLGHTPGTLALLVRVVLLVEGPMDERIIGAYLERELQDTATQILPLMGTREVHALPAASFLFNSTDAPVVVCLDNIDAKLIAAVRQQVLGARSDAERRRILVHAKGDTSVRKSSEMSTVVNLLSAAADAHRLDRIHVFGFKKRDIVQYLPVDLIKPGETSWAELWDQFKLTLGQGPPRGDIGAAFKKFVGRGYTVKGVEHALDRLRLDHPGVDGLSKHRPIEFTRLAELLRSLARR